MTERLFFLNGIKPGISEDEASLFLRSRDIPMARTIDSITSYVVARVDGQVFGNDRSPYDFIDAVEVTSVAEYREEIRRLETTERWRQFDRDWNRHFTGLALRSSSLISE